MKTQKSVKNLAYKTGVTADKLSHAPVFVPEWQVELGKEELKNIAEGNTELTEWREAKKTIYVITNRSRVLYTSRQPIW